MGNELAEKPQVQKGLSLIAKLAARFSLEPAAFHRTIKATIMPKASDEEVCAFLMVCEEHGLNPVTREIYAFPKQGGGIQPIVGIDGWLRIINQHPQFDGMEFEDAANDGVLAAVTCVIFRKDRTRPTKVTEYLSECKRNTDPWRNWPARMLRHKATIQCARYAFGFAGIMDEDEAERAGFADAATIKRPEVASLTMKDVTGGDEATHTGPAETQRKPVAVKSPKKAQTQQPKVKNTPQAQETAQEGGSGEDLAPPEGFEDAETASVGGSDDGSPIEQAKILATLKGKENAEELVNRADKMWVLLSADQQKIALQSSRLLQFEDVAEMKIPALKNFLLDCVAAME